MSLTLSPSPSPSPCVYHFSALHSHSSDDYTFSTSVAVSDRNEIPDQACGVYLEPVLNVSPASSSVVTLLNCLDSSGRYGQIILTSIE